jgi:hypothetical protein
MRISWKVTGAFALLLFLAAGLVTIRAIITSPASDVGCDESSLQAATKFLPTVQGDGPLILGVGGTAPDKGPDIRLNGSLCMIVANVLPAARETVLKAQLADWTTRAEVLDARLRTDPETPATTPEARKARDDQVATTRNDLVISRARQAEADQALRKAREDTVLWLFINAVKTPITAQVRGDPKPQIAHFQFSPASDASSADAVTWRTLIRGLPRRDADRAVKIGIGGPEDKLPKGVWVPTTGKAGATLHGVDLLPLLLAIAGFLLLAATLFLLDRDTGLLRVNGRESAYSLSRVQLAFWMMIGLFGFVLIWGATGQYYNVMTAGMFTLMGIAGATGLVGRALPGPAAAGATASGSFVKDLLTGANGQVELHRLQLVLWTLVLGSATLYYLFIDLRFIDLDANLLILMGISNGVYAGMRTQERPPEAPDPPAAR